MNHPNNPSRTLSLNDLDYLETQGQTQGLSVMLVHDFYPEGHQGGVSIIQHGKRVATNGDLRLEPSPGQWSPIPAVGERSIDRDAQGLSVRMSYPDESRNRKGFNPIEYPDLELSYRLSIRPFESGFRLQIDLDDPVPDEWAGQVGLNLELFPGYLFGKSFLIDDRFGIFPRQANGPGAYDEQGNYRIAPLGKGRKLTVAPETDHQVLQIESVAGREITLLDGRGRHNNGWFIVRSLVEPGKTKEAVAWDVFPEVDPLWIRPPSFQYNQVGYHPNQRKRLIIELDRNDDRRERLELLRLGATGSKRLEPQEVGEFLRYRYLEADFTDLAPGIYQIVYGDKPQGVVQISQDIHSRHVWQPTLDTFLPVQMCHMRVRENYRVWHGACHMDDAVMAPTDLNHFDGYVQGPTTLCDMKSGDRLDLAVGGWHDAGDFDIRIESQAQTIHGIALAYEEFELDYDNTTIDQATKTVEIHRPDGIPDALQQILHGCLSITCFYKATGRLYRGIIERDLTQYTHLGDCSTVTDNLPSDDDRWVFTEDNPRHELIACAALAAAARVLPKIDETEASTCREIAEKLWLDAKPKNLADRVEAAIELYLLTSHAMYVDAIIAAKEEICSAIEKVAPVAARTLSIVQDSAYRMVVTEALTLHASVLKERQGKTPYGVPYEPNIWGAGWSVQRTGVDQYWLNKAMPDVFSIEPMFEALNFVLGCHPGENNASFVSGVGAKSVIPGYGINRADESYIPGGVASGTALIRPDFPELLEWPYLWQQTEYCLGYPTTDFIFLAAAVDRHFRSANSRK